MSLQEAFLTSMVDRFGRVPGGWAYTWAYIGCWWLILLMFYRKKTFVRI
jgi:predicted acyltransferase